jgi:hypothetical protein
MSGQAIIRMRCGKVHPRLFRLPEGASVDWQGLAPWIQSGHWTSEPGKRQEPILLRCGEPGCNRAMRAFEIQGRYSDKIECGPRCQSATGPSCECTCRGENHGGN